MLQNQQYIIKGLCMLWPLLVVLRVIINMADAQKWSNRLKGYVHPKMKIQLLCFKVEM